MFAALKRITGKGETPIPGTSSPLPRPGLQSMAQNLQRKFARGVQYNMKIIIKGDRNVGKTTLFHRLKGEKFIEEYTPSEEIQVASIQWSYKATDDVVKVEVWDVVDRGKKKKRIDGLKLENAGPAIDLPEEPALDAEFLDVYKGTNGVIIVLDITKNWTFEYVQRELPKVPTHIPVLILANHCDMSHHRSITPDHIIYYVESQQRPEGCAQICYAESSMRNGFGLKYLHKFLNLPFLQLQRETLLAQLETNSKETIATVSELDAFQAGPDADYNQFLENLVNKRRQIAESSSGAGTQAQSFTGIGHATTAVPHSSTTHQLPAPGNQPREVPMCRSSSGPIGPIGGGHFVTRDHPGKGGNVIVIGNPSGAHPLTSTSKTVSQNTLLTEKNLGTDSTDSTAELGKKTSGVISNFFGIVGNDKQPNLYVDESVRGNSGSVISVEEFVPDEGVIDRSFLEDCAPQSERSPQTQQSPDSDSDGEVDGNPLVAGFQDDIDSDEDFTQPLPSATLDNPDTQNDPNSQIDTPKSESTPTKAAILVPERKVSAASSTDKKSVQDESSLDGEVSDITGDALDAWFSSDSKWRRSPEGGEDNGSRASGVSRGSRDAEVELSNEGKNTSCTSEKKKKSKKEKDNDNGDDKVNCKRHKKKSKDREKDKKNKSGRSLHSEERSRDELEEFLNGSASSPVESAYEAF